MWFKLLRKAIAERIGLFFIHSINLPEKKLSDKRYYFVKWFAYDTAI